MAKRKSTINKTSEYLNFTKSGRDFNDKFERGVSEHYFFYLFYYLIANLYPVDSKFHGFHTLGDNLVKIYQYAMRKGDLID